MNELTERGTGGEEVGDGLRRKRWKRYIGSEQSDEEATRARSREGKPVSRFALSGQ